MIDPLLQRTLEMREGLAGAPEFHVFANVVSAFLTSRALFARKADFEGNFVAGLEI
jgi:hypothetical protein